MTLAGKTLAVLGASYLQAPLLRRARDLGVRTLCFAWPQDAACRNEADRFFPISIREKDEIAAICRAEGIDGIASIASDAAVPTMVSLADELGLPGNPLRSLLPTTDKGAMREALARAGVPCPRFRRARDIESARAAAAELGFPLIVKPCDRSGSLGVLRVENPAAVTKAAEAALACSFGGAIVLEEAIDIAREFSVEGISWQGEYHLLAFTDKTTTGAPHYVEIAQRQPSTLPEAVKNAVAEHLARALPALGITTGASHAEWMLSAAGELFVTEIGARMGGDFIGSDLVLLSTGYDYLRGVIETALGEFSGVAFGAPDAAGIRFFSPETPEVAAALAAKPRPPWIVRGECAPDRLRLLAASADRAGYLIYRGAEGAAWAARYGA